MLRSLFSAATGMKAQQLTLDVISNNLANVNTSGFKKSRAAFQDLLYQSMKTPGTASSEGNQVPSGIQVGLGVATVSVQKLNTQGDFISTGNDLDLVIEGDGFFQVTKPDGTVSYTRDGSFKLDKDGRIVNSDGYPLEPAITIPSDTTKVSISVDGKINVMQSNNTSPVEIGTIEIARFANPAGLASAGKNLFTLTDASGAALAGIPGTEGRGNLNQGFIENSNVNVVEELANLIIAQRAFELNSKAVQASDEMLQSTSALKR